MSHYTFGRPDPLPNDLNQPHNRERFVKAMNCIDAIEGVVKKVISDFHDMHGAGEIDDTEFARHTRIVIDGTDNFVVENCEITPSPELLKTVLFEYARDLWKSSLAERDDALESERDDEYDNYYFDYIFRHGIYPE